MSLKDNFKLAAKDLLPGGPEEMRSAPAEASVREELPQIRTLEERYFPTPPQHRTIIAEGMSVHGSVKGSGAMDIFGSWIGDVEIDNTLRLSGQLEGNAICQTLELRGGRVMGDLSVSAHVEVDRESVVMGNIQAASISLGGKIKGDLNVSGSLSMSSESVLLGQVTASALSIMEGAVLQGRVQITSVEADKYFRDAPRQPTSPVAPQAPVAPQETISGAAQSQAPVIADEDSKE